MKTKTRPLAVYLPVFLLLLPILTALRTLALINNLDDGGIYFDDKFLITLGNIMLALASFFYLSYIFIEKKSIKLIPSFATPSAYAASGITVAATVFMIAGMIINAKDAIELIFEKPSDKTAKTMLIIAIIVAVFAVLSLIHLFLTALSEKVSSSLRANFAMATVLFLSGYAVYIYLDRSVPMNSPAKAIDMLSYLSAALFFLYETRLSMGRAKWRAYISTALISATLCAYSSIPTLILYFKDGRLVSNSIYESVLTFALFIFITSRLLLTARLIEDKESPVVSALVKLADARAEEIKAHEAELALKEEKRLASLENIEEPDENQLTIEELIFDEGTDTAEEELTDEEDTCS